MWSAVLAASLIQFDNHFQGSKAGEPAETLEKSSEGCQHKYRLDEELGICCIICGFVLTEIKYVAPPFVSQLCSPRIHLLFFTVYQLG